MRNWKADKSCTKDNIAKGRDFVLSLESHESFGLEAVEYIS
jgi:hypothetical protein